MNLQIEFSEVIIPFLILVCVVFVSVSALIQIKVYDFLRQLLLDFLNPFVVEVFWGCLAESSFAKVALLAFRSGIWRATLLLRRLFVG